MSQGFSTFLIEQTALEVVTGASHSDATTLAALKRALNDAYHELLEAYDWPWARVRSAVNLIASYTTGTITLTAGAVTLTSSGATWDTAWSPVRIRSAAGHDYLATWGGSAWTIDRNAVVTETAVAYTLYKDTYQLTARLRSLYIGWGTVQGEAPVELITENEMQVLRTTFVSTTPVRKVCLVEPDSTNFASQLMVWPPPSAAESIHYRGYIQVVDLTADSDTYSFPLSALSLYRRLAKSLAWEYRGALQRAADERGKYELDLKRHIARSDDTAHAQDKISLDENHFLRRSRPYEGTGYADNVWDW